MESPALDLINTEWWYGRGPKGIEDQLLEPNGLEALLARHGLDPATPPSARDRSELVRLRALLRQLVTPAARGESLPREDLAELDEFVGAATFSRRLAVARGAVSVALEPPARDWRWVLSELATSFAELLEANADGRLKLCANAECRWAFYDETKNRRRRWCGHASCGDLDKVRRFRERQRAARAALA